MSTEVIASVISSLVDSAKRLMDFLTYGRLALLFCLIVIGLATIMVYENRQPIYTTLTAGEKYSAADYIPELSQTTVTLIKNAVNRQGNIIAVQVIGMDFRNNTRDTTFFFSKLEVLRQEFESFLDGKVTSPPLFATAEPDQNQRLIRIMEQEFVCVDTPLNIIEMIPSASREVQQVCSISVPPRFGKMVGYVNIWLAKPMQPQQLANYKSIARQISDEIYDRDVLKSKI